MAKSSYLKIFLTYHRSLTQIQNQQFWMKRLVVEKTLLIWKRELMSFYLKWLKILIEKTIGEYETIEAQFKNLGGYALKAKASRILIGLGIEENRHHDSALSLSGGQRMRLELAKIFVREPEFLILDEPTNHLDLPSLIWVENYLKSFKGTVLFVSHDRSLLNNLGEMLIHLDNGKFEIFNGNFDQYLEYREAQLELEQKQFESLQKETKPRNIHH